MTEVEAQNNSNNYSNNQSDPITTDIPAQLLTGASIPVGDEKYQLK